MAILYLPPDRVSGGNREGVPRPEEESLLLAALKRAYNRSTFWRRRLNEIDVDENDFRPGFPFADLPLLTKADILADQHDAPPFGSLLAVDPTAIRRIHKTSGTSATPFYIALTDQDVEDTYHASVRAFRAAGMGPGDRVVHCLNFSMWSGGVTDYMPIEKLGATGIPFGVGNTTLLLRTIRELGINAISSTPSYMFALRDRCRREIGLDPRELGLRKGYFGGEGLLQVPGVRQEIEDTFGLEAIDANYGMSEVLSIIAGEGDARDGGLINHTHGILYTELLDDTGRPLPIEPCARGELVFSSLRREAQPLFRYRTNDLVEIVWSKKEEDDLLRMGFRVLGRSDEMLVIKGVNFFPQSLLSVVAEFEPRISREYRVELPRAGAPKKVRVLLETAEADDAARTALAADFAKKVAAVLQIQVDVAWTAIGTIPEGENKKRYLVDDISRLIA